MMHGYTCTFAYILMRSLLSLISVDSCCTKPDIQLTVDCTSIPEKVQWQWQSETATLWGFLITYSCEELTDENYCNEKKNYTQVASYVASYSYSYMHFYY